MKADEQNLAIMSKTNNYNSWIYNNIKKHIGNRVLEIGCGMGNMTTFFINKPLVVGVDVSNNNIKAIKNRFKNKKNLVIIKYDISKKYKELKRYRFDTVICINVLEHMRNDKKALENIYSVLEKNGNLILMVPAFQALYGTIDKANKHYRRYNKKQIKSLLKQCNFKIKRIVYMNLFGLLGWWYHNKFLKISVHNTKDLLLFDKLAPFLSFTEKIIHPPIGLSLIVIAEK